MPQPQTADPVESLLKRMPLTNAMRADLWDAFHESADVDELAAKLEPLRIPKLVKADLWDLKQSSPRNQPAVGDDVTALMRGRYLSTDPNAGAPSSRYLSTDPNAGLPAAVNQVTARAEDFMPAQKPEGSAVGRFVGGAVEMLNPVAMVKGVANVVAHPIDTLTNIGEASADQWRQATELAAQGRYVEAAGHGLAVLPIIGPAAAQAGEQIASGDIAGGMGRGAGLLGTVLAPAGARAAKRAMPVKAPVAATVADEAAQFASRRGIPMSVGQATRNPVARGLEQLNEHTSIGGSVVARNARARQAAGLTRVGDELASQVHPSPMMPEQAGQAVRDAVTARAAAYDAAADAAYAKLRAVEAQQASAIQRTGGIQGPATSTKPFTDVPLAVDIAPTKAAMKPVYEALLRERELNGVMMGDKARALSALDRLMQAPDVAPLSIADSALGDLKSVARVDQAFRRTTGQGVVAQAVSNLDQAVRATATQAGPKVFSALMDGRAATVNKFKTIDVLDKLRAEPVQVFNQATYAKDAGVATLRDIAKAAPGELPKIGRAFLDDLLNTATSEGGFGKAQSIATKWQNLGPQTKALLFKDAALVKELDRFFLFAKKAGESMNPSGSAFVGTLGAKGVFTVMNLATGIPLEIGQTILAKALWNPTIVRLLNRAAMTPAKATGPARLVAAELTKAMRLAGLLPATSPSGSQIPATAPSLP